MLYVVLFASPGSVAPVAWHPSRKPTQTQMTSLALPSRPTPSPPSSQRRKLWSTVPANPWTHQWTRVPSTTGILSMNPHHHLPLGRSSTAQQHGVAHLHSQKALIRHWTPPACPLPIPGWRVETGVDLVRDPALPLRVVEEDRPAGGTATGS